MGRRRAYSDTDFRKAIAESETLAQALTKIGLRPVGGNYELAKKRIITLGIKTDHLVGQGWKRGKYLSFDGITRPETIKKLLLRERGRQCEICKRKTWLGKPITIELDHINGDRTDNSKKNLRLLCPNCHSQTDTWKGKNHGGIAQLAGGASLKTKTVTGSNPSTATTKL